MIRVLLVGGIRLHREGLAALLARDGLLPSSAAGGAAGAVLRPTAEADVIVVDSPGPGELEPMRQLAATGSPLVVVGVEEDEHAVIRLAECGVLGFVGRYASLDELVASILAASRGEASIPPPFATLLLRRLNSVSAQRAAPEATALTVRERQIVDLIGDSLSNKEIATRLCIEVATVKNHVHNILEKLQVSRRLDAVAYLRAVEGGGGYPVEGMRSPTRSSAA